MSSDVPANPRRLEGGKTGRFAIAVGVLALLASVYTVIRIDVLRDRINIVRDGVRDLENAHSVLRAEQDELSSSADVTNAKLAPVEDMRKELSALAAAVDELRGRTDQPQRTWARAEALYLLQLAERQLQFTRDVRTAIAAVEAADTRLSELRDPTLAAVRAQIAKDLQALRAVPDPDRGNVLLRLNRAEAQVAQLPVAGLAVNDAQPSTAALPDSGPQRAWAVLKRTFSRLFTVREISGSAARLVSADERQLRREHLQLLLSSARQAVINADPIAYQGMLESAARWLQQSFDVDDAAVQTLTTEIDALRRIQIAPPLPDVTESVRLLKRFVAGSSAS